MARIDRRRFAMSALGAVGAATLPARADTVWDVLRRPGTAAVMRHALAPGTGDPANFTLGDCTTQRNLDDRGRAQAQAIGAAFRAHDVGIDRVLTSQWCRCRETARLLGLGDPEDLPSLNSFFADRSTRDAQTRATRRFLTELPNDARVVLVTHQVNIRALTGRFTRSGEVIVLDLAPGEDFDVAGELLIDA